VGIAGDAKGTKTVKNTRLSGAEYALKVVHLNHLKYWVGGCQVAG